MMGFKFLFNVVCTLVAYITYSLGNQDFPDDYTLTLGPAALRLGHIYQANSSCPCYNLYKCICSYGMYLVNI